MASSIIQLEEQIDEIEKLCSDSFFNPVNNQINKPKISAALYNTTQLCQSIHQEMHLLSCTDRRTIYADLHNHFDRLNKILANHDINLKEQLNRQIKAITGVAPTGVTSTEVQEQIMQQLMINSDREKTSLIILKEQHTDILALGESIIQLQQIFIDLANLVDIQGEQIDNIQDNVQDAEIRVANATKELKRGREYVSSTRKKCCCIATCGLCTLLSGVAGGAAACAGGFCSIQ
jgi:t-SNARE complex subunit (syntaxin)